VIVKRAASALLVAACAALAPASSGCGPSGPPPTVSMRMAGGPPEARVTVDENYINTLAVVEKRGIALPVGTHRITVEAPGYFPWDQIVSAKEGDAPIKLSVQLMRIPE
jgi:hypothetical protein